MGVPLHSSPLLLSALSNRKCNISQKISESASARRDKPKRRAALCLEAISFNYFDRHSKIVGENSNDFSYFAKEI